jgi:cytochrome P450
MTIRAATSSHRLGAQPVPGPQSWSPLGHVFEFNRNRALFFRRLASDYGDIVKFRLGFGEVFLLTHPDYIKDVLVTRQRAFHKGRALARAKRLMGDGLLTSEEEFHLRQRRLMQPAFHRERIAAYARTMVQHSAELSHEWQDGQTFDVRDETTRVTLAIVCRVLFDADARGDAADVGRAFSELMELASFLLAPYSEYLERLPLPQSIRFRRAKARLNRVVSRFINERRQAPGDRGDLLSTLLAAEDEDGPSGGMKDQQVHDECMTLLVAGHETLANTLTWTWYLLSQHPQVESTLQDELGTVLGGRLPTLDDLPNLPYTEMVLLEAMRLYPPAWFLSRRALEPYEVGGFALPKGAQIVLSQYVTHRDPRYYPCPDRFDPDRWKPEARAARPKFAYFPFGAGVRGCIGESFAMTEGRLILAVLAARWKLSLVPGHPVVVQAASTLRPKYGMRMTAHRRESR